MHVSVSVYQFGKYRLSKTTARGQVAACAVPGVVTAGVDERRGASCGGHCTETSSLTEMLFII